LQSYFNPLRDQAMKATDWKEGAAEMPLAEILRSVSEFLFRYIVFPKPAHAVAVSLWVAHTWVMEALDYTPYLLISSPTKRCGKSRVFDCLRLLCKNAWPVVSITEAVLFRKIERDSPTLLLDEVDTVFSANGSDPNKEGLRALLNAGFERRARVARCMGPQHILMEFPVFCPKAFAGIGKLPDTVADRSIPILLSRRAPGEHIEKFRARDAELIAKPITDSLETWGSNLNTVQQLHAARPKLPDALGDRAADICEPLLAIADMAGGVWPAMARAALVELCAESNSNEGIGIRLLAAIREIFEARAADRISTEDLLDELTKREDGEPWGAWEKDIKAGNTRGPGGKLARYLMPFDIVSGTIRQPDGSTPRGYKLASFGDAFSRYLPVEPPF
jgi:hypothetical protein